MNFSTARINYHNQIKRWLYLISQNTDKPNLQSTKGFLFI